MKRINSINPACFLFIVALILVGCNKDDGDVSPSTESQILISPDQILINDNETKTVFLSVQPPSAFQWNVASKPGWIEINPASGTINDEILELILTPDPAGLSLGKHSGVIEIITNGAGKAVADIELCVDAHPVANVSPAEVMYSASESEKTLTISNTGTGFLNWELNSLPSWINTDISSGVLDESESVGIVASAQRNGLPVGTQTGQAVLVSNSEEGEITIDFTLEVGAMAIMSLSEESLSYGYFEDSLSFFVRNEGNIPFDWSWDDNSNAFLSASPNAGTLAVGGFAEVTLQVDRTNLNSQTYDLEVFINNDEGQSIELPVQINHFQEQKWFIDGRVIDAEYDRVHDVIIVVSENPDEIRKFNPANSQETSLALNIPPTCVSVSQDGNSAVVGHNGSFTYVNLMTMQTIDNYAVTADAFDIVLAPNEWVYVFPREDQWERIRCVNLSTGAETQHTGNLIYDETKARLHPSGDFIYGADNGLSPSDFEKYDIRNGTAEYLYDSPYHGDFAFSGDIWISEDGNRLFAKSRNVFNASANENNDMTYNGELVGEGRIATLDFSTDAQRVYAIFTTGGFGGEEPLSEIRMYETEFLGFQGTMNLPGFLIPDGSGGGDFYDSQGHFGFFNSDGTKYYVLVRVEEGAGAQNEWAIATVDVE